MTFTEVRGFGYKTLRVLDGEIRGPHKEHPRWRDWEEFLKNKGWDAFLRRGADIPTMDGDKPGYGGIIRQIKSREISYQDASSGGLEEVLLGFSLDRIGENRLPNQLH